MIPPLIHQTWKDSEIPFGKYHPRWVDSWRRHHPSWEYRLWTDDDLRDLADRYYPAVAELFDTMPGIIRADIGRLMILDQVGGLYVDLDYEALKPLDPLVRRKGAWLVLPRITRGRSKAYVHNALMAAVPAHPFFKLAIAEACRRCKRHPSAWVEWISGPDLITELIGQLAGRSVAPLFLGQDDVTPLDWKTRRKGWAEIMEDPAKAFPEASAITYWKHNW